MYVAYRDENKENNGVPIKGKQLFFLKISPLCPSVGDIPKKLDALQRGPVGRFGIKALSNRELPIIVLQEMFFIYRGKDNVIKTIEVMHVAHGKPANVILGEDLPSIQSAAEKIGKALGLFHIEFMDYNSNSFWQFMVVKSCNAVFGPPLFSSDSLLSPWTTMIHGDFHRGNVLFDKETTRVYFIDNSTMQRADPSYDLFHLKRDTRDALSGKNVKLVYYIVYFVKGYLNAYPSNKRERVVKCLRLELELFYSKAFYNKPSEGLEFLPECVTTLDNIFREALPSGEFEEILKEEIVQKKKEIKKSSLSKAEKEEQLNILREQERKLKEQGKMQ